LNELVISEKILSYWTLPRTALGQIDIEIQHFVKRASQTETLMSSGQEEIKNIVSQLQRLHLQETELLHRLEQLSEADSNTPGSSNPAQDSSSPREFIIGDQVLIRNPKPFQSKRGVVIKIGIGTNRVTVQTKNGTKIVRAPHNIILIN
jgi:hypothetical protein